MAFLISKKWYIKIPWLNTMQVFCNAQLENPVVLLFLYWLSMSQWLNFNNKFGSRDFSIS